MHPCGSIQPGETFTLADIEGSGCVQQIWMTPTGTYRHSILRIYYDDQTTPSVECPIGDFFASAFTNYDVFAPISSHCVCVNPGNAFNCYWPMPFRKRFRMTLENVGIEAMRIYFQINYALGDVPEDAAYFHAQFRRTNPLPYKDVYTIIDGIQGKGHYVGTYLAWQMNNDGWWGEGEIKFYLDGDTDPALSDGKVVAGSTGSAGRGRKTISAAPTTLRTRRPSNIRNTRPPMLEFHRFAGPTALTKPTCGSACIAGMSATRSGLTRI